MQTVVKKKSIGTKEMALIGVMTAITCIAAPFSIYLPVSPVPLTLVSLALYFSLYVLGTKKALISYVIYLAIGFVGLPVFSGFTGGIGKVAGPTGGYLIGFLFMIPVSGILLEKLPKKIRFQIPALILGTLVCYLFGTLWLCVQLKMNFAGGLGVGVVPYLPGDLAKIVIASMAGPAVAKTVNRAV